MTKDEITARMNDVAGTLRCVECGAEYLTDCDVSKHVADAMSFSRYMRRTERIYVLKLRALGVTA